MSKKVESGTPAAFVRAFITTVKAGRTEEQNSKWVGVHTVYEKVDGLSFNQYYRTIANARGWELRDPVQATEQLDKEGKIIVRHARGGAYLILPEDSRPLTRSGKMLTLASF